MPRCSTNHYLFVFELCNNVKYRFMLNEHQSVSMNNMEILPKRQEFDEIILVMDGQQIYHHDQ